MKAWEDYAMIVGEDVVNVCCFRVGGYTMAQWVAQEQYGSEAFAVDVSQIATGIGAKYRNGVFYNVDPNTGEETPAVIIPTDEQNIQENTNAIDDLFVMVLEG